MKVYPLIAGGPHVFIESLIMFTPLMGWAIVWILDGSGLSLGPELVFASTRGLVCNILSFYVINRLRRIF